MYDSARARKLWGVSDFARWGESERKCDRPLSQHSQKGQFSGNCRSPRDRTQLKCAIENTSRVKGGRWLRPGLRLRASWAIVRILPNAEHYTIARFVNRQDADDRRRALCRFIPGGVFEVMCDRA
ncbi:MAG: hypothetical protein EAZ09_12060 [Oscillatoriales cyanobacterium]|nr:MAG: hypothetical protein EAZ18_03100 [Oscillatoriales cyanobacterium]TAH21553.1 MAG: hypothetical protein EAZ09_12060 [Oscillatoriales cyanobacterium]